jgi:F-type H+-transporting ATPase subunit epsilon
VEAKKQAEEALRNAKDKLDQAAIQNELMGLAAQIAALRKFRAKR